MEMMQQFAPYEDLAAQLMPHALETADDASHDMSHLLRVWRNVQIISGQDGGDRAVLLAATLLHDCVNLPKDSPQRSTSSLLASQKALKILDRLDWPEEKAQMVAHAIEAHSFSANIKPKTLEARILQDADRLDAIGYTGIARCFYVSGRLGRALYDPNDPDASHRALDDSTFAIDHFQTKLLKLSAGLQTPTGRKLARQRHETVLDFLHGFLQEVHAPNTV